MKKIKLVVLLGNPGKTYADNRHNAGRRILSNPPIDLRWQNKFKALYAEAGIPLSYGQNGAAKTDALYVADTEAVYNGGQQARQVKAHFLMPETYMNLSGDSVIAAANFYKINSAEILVVHDELDLPLGQVSFKEGGGLGGHNGLRSIKAALGSADFWRMRIGIGRPGGKKDPSADISAWVLSDFTKEEVAVLQQIQKDCADALFQAVVKGPDTLLPAWSKMSLYPSGGGI
ncbi:MAG: aminoacyl-tRNA hydrolase [Spirochaetaceae bacterium]|jgi:PTH1 family peptidyl-tRNA hydrolase|nr:aminoacyl-tRNA hydrolase [Spirochaetaceae bacterium]